MFAPAIAFVDLETTGTTARDDRVTEVGIVCVDAAGDVTEWSTLVNPQCSIPAEIQALTGITNAMVDGAPTFAQVAAEIETRIAGCVFVAHNARFDYGFLKHEFGRLGRAFSAKVLCTVKLSRRLYPNAARHNLDTLIERHSLVAADRHRALGDARILWQFVQAIYRDRQADEVNVAVLRILKSPSLPSHLPADALDSLPEAPGTYRFYGLNAHPLYIGKSVNLRERVAAHFSGDYRSVSDLRLSTEIRRIEVEETAGELGALLRESQLIKTLLPAYNVRLRKRDAMVALKVGCESGPPEFVTIVGDRSEVAGPSLRSVRIAKLRARDVAPSGARRGALLVRAGPRATYGRVLRATGWKVRGRVRRRRIPGCASRPVSSCTAAARAQRLAISRQGCRTRGQRDGGPHRGPCFQPLVLAGDGQQRRRIA